VHGVEYRGGGGKHKFAGGGDTPVQNGAHGPPSYIMHMWQYLQSVGSVAPCGVPVHHWLCPSWLPSSFLKDVGYSFAYLQKKKWSL